MPPLKRINVEVSGYCNYSCVSCPNADGRLIRGKGFMNTGLFNKILDESKNSLEKIYFWNYGEPLLHPRIQDLLGRVGELHPKTIMSTNGSKLVSFKDLSFLLNLDEIIVSINGVTPEVYSYHHRGGNLKTVLKGVRKLSEYTGGDEGTDFTLQMVINKKNVSQIEKFLGLAESYRADRAVLKTFNVMDGKRTTYEEFVPDQKEYSRERNESRPSRLPCLESTVINWNGSINPCCWDYEGRHVLGDISSQGLHEAWDSEEYKLFREYIRDNELDICSDCSVNNVVKEVRF